MAGVRYNIFQNRIYWIINVRMAFHLRPTALISVYNSGSNLALTLSAKAHRNAGRCIYGLILVVPAPNTNPDLEDRPWGVNQNALGLTVERYLDILQLTFGDLSERERDDPDYNPCKMTDDLFKSLPQTMVIIAQYDILYKSGMEFAYRIGNFNRNKVDITVVQGLHMVKDMYDTYEGQHVYERCIEFMGQLLSRTKRQRHE